ncbi:MAG: acid shock protein [Clostridia bacterium]|nr:acid shock protein [Clostridia bacterium]
MKKILVLVVALAMMLSAVAFAEPTAIEYGTENTLVFAREVAYAAEAGDVDALGNPTDGGKVPTGIAHITAWKGQWVLAAAYVSESGLEEYDLEGEEGFYAVPENAVFLELEPAYDASANDPSGPLVDVANYFHAHCYDLNGTITLPEDIDEEGFKVKNVWSDWGSVVRGNADGDFNFGPAKVTIKGEDDYLYWNELTGFDFEEIEEFKFIGANLDGQIVIAACEKNPVTKPDTDIWFALIFDKVAE